MTKQELVQALAGFSPTAEVRFSAPADSALDEWIRDANLIGTAEIQEPRRNMATEVTLMLDK